MLGVYKGELSVIIDISILYVMSNQPDRLSLTDALKEAGKCFEQGSYYRSEAIYAAILKASPNHLVASARLALINESYGKYREALSLYENIVNAHPVDIGIVSGFIRLLIKTGNIEQARLTLKRSAALYRQVNALDQYNSLFKQLNPKKKLEFFYKYLESLGVFDYEEDDLMASDAKASPLLTNSFLGWFVTQHWQNKTLLELGSGSSTLYFANHFEKVVSLETSSKWYSILSERLPSNVEYKKVDAIIDGLMECDLDEYDVVLIDCSENRAEVARLVTEKNFNGVVFFDNAEWYRNGISFFTDSGYSEIPFFGIKPVQDRISCTSVLFNSHNVGSVTNSHWQSLPEFSAYRPKNAWDKA